MIIIIINKVNLNEFNIENIKLENIIEYLIEAKLKIIDYLLTYQTLNIKDILQKLKYNDLVKHLFSILSTSLIIIKTDNL